jgi:hypothetical protein
MDTHRVHDDAREALFLVIWVVIGLAVAGATTARRYMQSG